MTLDKFSLPYKRGGLTWSQVDFMFSHSVKAKANEYKIIGAFHGINLDADSNVPEDQLPPDVKNPKHFVFGDPAAYDKMSEADKEELTQKMMSHHKDWSSSSGMGKGV